MPDFFYQPYSYRFDLPPHRNTRKHVELGDDRQNFFCKVARRHVFPPNCKIVSQAVQSESLGTRHELANQNHSGDLEMEFEMKLSRFALVWEIFSHNINLR